MAIHVATGTFQGLAGQWLCETLCGKVVPEGEPIGEAEARIKPNIFCKVCDDALSRPVAAPDGEMIE